MLHAHTHFFEPATTPDDDEAVVAANKETTAALKVEWERFCKARPQVSNLMDVVAFWKTRSIVLSNAIEPYLWYPVTGAAIERSFSLAGLIDTKNRQRMGKDLRQAAVTMFCNGDVEGRFTRPE